jgi:hypothetical protein
MGSVDMKSLAKARKRPKFIPSAQRKRPKFIPSARLRLSVERGGGG